MEEKRKDLEAEQQKKLIYKLVAKLNDLHPSLYYSATSEVAYHVDEYIKAAKGLSRSELELLKGLSRHDIQMILSLHN